MSATASLMRKSAEPKYPTPLFTISNSIMFQEDSKIVIGGVDTFQPSDKLHVKGNINLSDRINFYAENATITWGRTRADIFRLQYYNGEEYLNAIKIDPSNGLMTIGVPEYQHEEQLLVNGNVNLSEKLTFNDITAEIRAGNPTKTFIRMKGETGFVNIGDYQPGASLQVGQTIGFHNGAEGDFFSRNNNFINNTRFIDGYTSLIMMDNNGVIRFKTSDYGTAGTTSNMNEPLTLFPNQHVGINIPEGTIATEALQIGDRWTFHSGGSKVIGYNFDWTPNGNARIVENDPVITLGMGSVGLTIKTASGGTGGSIINPAEWNTNLCASLDGRIGIGTTTPMSYLHISDIGEAGERLLQVGNDTYFTDLDIQDILGLYGAFDETRAGLKFGSQGPLIMGEQGQLTINDKVIIGNPSITPAGYKLYVEEGIITERVKVELTTNWSDFVFEDDYELRSLSELESFIQQNKHLPEIPSAAQVEEQGIDLGEMDAKLLQKVEELTLYIIEQQNQIESLKSEIDNLKN